jgi:hypothetical protein
MIKLKKSNLKANAYSLEIIESQKNTDMTLWSHPKLPTGYYIIAVSMHGAGFSCNSSHCAVALVNNVKTKELDNNCNVADFEIVQLEWDLRLKDVREETLIFNIQKPAIVA